MSRQITRPSTTAGPCFTSSPVLNCQRRSRPTLSIAVTPPALATNSRPCASSTGLPSRISLPRSILYLIHQVIPGVTGPIVSARPVRSRVRCQNGQGSSARAERVPSARRTRDAQQILPRRGWAWVAVSMSRTITTCPRVVRHLNVARRLRGIKGGPVLRKVLHECASG